MTKSQAAALRCYHSVPLAQLQVGEYVADPERTPALLARMEYRWLESKIGFYPLFLAFGGRHAIDHTFYGSDYYPTVPPVITPHVMGIFSLNDISNPVFLDGTEWDECPNESEVIWDGLEPDTEWQRRIFKPSWSQLQWFEFAGKRDNDTQILASRLDFGKAQEIWVQDREALCEVERIGLKNAVIRKR